MALSVHEWNCYTFHILSLPFSFSTGEKIEERLEREWTPHKQWRDLKFTCQSTIRQEQNKHKIDRMLLLESAESDAQKPVRRSIIITLPPEGCPGTEVPNLFPIVTFIRPIFQSWINVSIFFCKIIMIHGHLITFDECMTTVAHRSHFDERSKGFYLLYSACTIGHKQ